MRNAIAEMRTLACVLVTLAALAAHAPAFAQASGPGIAMEANPDAHTGLLPLVTPHLERVEEKVKRRLRAAQSDFDSLSQDSNVTDQALGEAFGELGRVYHAHRLYDSAEPCYRNAERLLGRDPRWPYLLGYLYHQSARLDAARRSYERALELRPDHAPAQLRLAQALLGLNRPAEAESLLHRVLREPRVKGAAAFELGKAALARKEFAKSIKWLELARKEQPEASRIHYPLAMAYRGVGDLEAARRHLAERGDVDPEIPDPPVDALDELVSGVRTRQYHAMKAVWARQFDVAKKEFREILALEPDNVSARVSLARCLYMLGDKEAAGRELEFALKRDPEHEKANYFMGRLLKEQGKGDAALRHFRATLDQDPRHGGAHFNVGEALMGRGEFQQAVHHFAAVVDAAPEDLPPRRLEALALIATGSSAHGKARERLQEGLVSHPRDPLLTRVLARLLAASTDPQVRDGQQALTLAHNLFSEVNSIENAETVAMAYAELGRFERAVAYQQAAIDAATRYGGFELLAGLTDMLDRYRAGRACRTPWRAEDLTSSPRGVPAKLLDPRP